MSADELSRRRLLAGFGATAVVGFAGCAESSPSPATAEEPTTGSAESTAPASTPTDTTSAGERDLDLREANVVGAT